MKSPLNHLMTVCVALHRHLSRSARVASAVVMLSTVGCDSNPFVVTNHFPDGVDWEECEDDPGCNIVINHAPDADGDGVYEWDDCDDNDPDVGAAPEGETCSPPIDECEGEDELGCDIVVNPAPDADGDGVYEWDDCDDNDPDVGAAPEGETCSPPIDECEGEDELDCDIVINPAPDADSDGVYEWDDCDDNDPDVGAAPEGETCSPPA